MSGDISRHKSDVPYLVYIFLLSLLRFVRLLDRSLECLLMVVLLGDKVDRRLFELSFHGLHKGEVLSGLRVCFRSEYVKRCPKVPEQEAASLRSAHKTIMDRDKVERITQSHLYPEVIWRVLPSFSHNPPLSQP